MRLIQKLSIIALFFFLNQCGGNGDLDPVPPTYVELKYNISDRWMRFHQGADNYTYAYNPRFVYKILDPSEIQVEEVPIDLEGELINDLVVGANGAVYATTTNYIRMFSNGSTKSLTSDNFGQAIPSYIELVGNRVFIATDNIIQLTSGIYEVNFVNDSVERVNYTSTLGWSFQTRSMSSNSNGTLFICSNKYSDSETGSQLPNVPGGSYPASFSHGSGTAGSMKVTNSIGEASLSNGYCNTFTGADGLLYVKVAPSRWFKSSDDGSNFEEVSSFDIMDTNFFATSNSTFYILDSDGWPKKSSNGGQTWDQIIFEEWNGEAYAARALFADSDFEYIITGGNKLYIRERTP